ncbi:DNA recombination protein RmuC [Microbaculum marinum]|uniref:DNA recombination protein RmuC homolog n=1 Tax=Microbaculum marinum TaxID=1764581 RepID=A0AAW9RTM3_9HYPH
MNQILIEIGGRGVTVGEGAFAAAVLGFAILIAILFAVLRSGRPNAADEARRHEAELRLAEMSRAQAEMTGRMQTMAEVFSTRHADLARALGERLDNLGHRVGQSMETQTRATHDSLSKLNERLAVIDTAQKNITDLSREVVGLHHILANKQSRGAFGQGRMEAIVQDGLPTGAYEFQATLSNGRRPDCVVRFPNTDAVLVIDAKFPLEAFGAFRDAADEEARKQAAQRLRTDVQKHVTDIGERYFIPGETQDLAIMFVPSESIYADLHEHFEDAVQKAHRARIIVVGPSMLMLSIQVMQSILRDARMREQAHLIHKEVTYLSDDVRRLQERVLKLQGHFGQANKDIEQILTSSEKILKRGDKIEQLDLVDETGSGEKAGSPPAQPRLLAGE